MITLNNEIISIVVLALLANTEALLQGFADLYF